MKKISYIECFEKWVSEFQFYESVKVRFSETDMFGHVNNTVPFSYFETARIEYLHSLGFMQDWARPDSKTIPVVADLQCDFISQIFFGEMIKVFVKINKVGTSSIDIHYLGKKEDASICFTGRGALVNLNKLTGKGEPWTTEELVRFQSSMNKAVTKEGV